MNLPSRHPDGFARFQSLRGIFSIIWGFTMTTMKVMMMMKNDKAHLCNWRRNTAQQPLSAGKAENSSKKTEASSSPSVLASPPSLLCPSPSSCCFSAFPSKSSPARWLWLRSLASRLLRWEQDVAALDKLMRR